ncbi:MAG TPA: antitoxin [Actinocrinis sp.]|nr:antitoxin [Actinocrinis sp.]
MGILDKLRQHKDDTDGAAGAVKDKAAAGLDKAGQAADEKTGGTYTGQIDKGVDETKQAMGEGAPNAAQPPEQPAEAPPSDDTEEQPPAV